MVYKPTTVGGIQAVAGLIEAVRDRLNGSEHGGKVAPIVQWDGQPIGNGQPGPIAKKLLELWRADTLDSDQLIPVPYPAG